MNCQSIKSMEPTYSIKYGGVCAQLICPLGKSSFGWHGRILAEYGAGIILLELRCVVGE